MFVWIERLDDAAGYKRSRLLTYTEARRLVEVCERSGRSAYAKEDRAALERSRHQRPRARVSHPLPGGRERQLDWALGK